MFEATDREYVVRELRHLAGTDSYDSIARRLGYDSAVNLARVLYRWHYPELAHQVYFLESLSDRLPPWSPGDPYRD